VLNRKPGLSSPWAPSDEGAVAAATEGEKAAVNRKLSIVVTFLSLRASPTSLIISARRRYASEQPTKSALSESQREALAFCE